MKSAYPRFKYPVNITLYSNIPFDNTYSHHTLISKLFKYNSTTLYTGAINVPCESFINRKDYSKVGYPFYYPRYSLTGEYNFDYSNGLVCSVVLELTPEQTNANYMRVICTDDNDADTYYYFITGITQLNADTYRLNLELDVLMTYQDEFLNGVKDIPLFTIRKHSHRYANGHVFSPDYKLGESTFVGVKPSLVKQVVKSKLVVDNSITTGNKTKFSDMLWLYVTTDIVDKTHYVLGDSVSDNQHPFTVLVAPLGHTITFYDYTDHSKYYSIYMTNDMINKLISDGSYKCATISPYPPFALLTNPNIKSVDASVAGGMSIYGDDVTDSYHVTTTGGYAKLNGNTVLFGDNLANTTAKSDLLKHFMVLTIQRDTDYELQTLQYERFLKPAVHITANRTPDPKLLFAPFTKYCVTSAGSEEYEFFPELLCSLSPFTNSINASDMHLHTIKTAYAGDFTTFTYIAEYSLYNSVKGFENYKDNKIGLSSSPNYTFPVGTDALDVFKSTQAETFYQSKIASGITSGLTIAGGVGSVALGIAGAVGSMGMSTPASVGLIAGGVGAIGSGTASLVDTIKSTNAKIEDLKNTPSTINVSGSSYAHDFAMNINNCLPIVTTYNCQKALKEKADDFFYNFGYEVARDCTFNLELQFSNMGDLDNNLLGRTIFNYVKTDEDIVNKIDANIPLIVKQKLSAIFNNGITLWTFFGFSGIWNDSVPTSTYYVNKWFMKHKLDNTEYDGSTF